MTSQITDFEKAKFTVIKGNAEPRSRMEYMPIDLGISLTEEFQKRKLEDIFGWAKKTMLHRSLDINDLENADARRKDFERVLAATFTDSEDSRELESEEREMLLDMYYEMWKSIWKGQEKYPNVKELLKNIRSEATAVFKFIPDTKLGKMSPEKYIQKNAGRIWECDCSYAGLEKSMAQNESGYLFVAGNDAGGFPPVNIVGSLAVLAMTKTAWTEKELISVLERYHLTTPVMVKVDPERVLVFRK